MFKPIPPLPADSLTLVQVGGRGGLAEPWGWAENLDVIRFADPEPDEPGGEAGPRTIRRILASAPRAVTLHRTRTPGASSLLAPNESFLASLETDGAFDTVDAAACDATTLDEALAELEVGHVDVLDLDAPGREREILEGAQQTLLGGLFGVEVEVGLNPVYEGQPLSGEIDSLLRGFGYELFQFLPRSLRRKTGAELLALGTGQPVWAEALYFKGPNAAMASFEACGDEEREEAIGRAISICLLYGFGDYALDLVDFTSLPFATARRLRKTILRYDAHIDRSVPARFLREAHGRVLEPIETWLGDLRPAAAPGRTHVSLELPQLRRLSRVAGRGDANLGNTLREALRVGLRKPKEDLLAKRRNR